MTQSPRTQIRQISVRIKRQSEPPGTGTPGLPPWWRPTFLTRRSRKGLFAASSWLAAEIQ